MLGAGKELVPNAGGFTWGGKSIRIEHMLLYFEQENVSLKDMSLRLGLYLGHKSTSAKHMWLLFATPRKAFLLLLLGRCQEKFSRKRRCRQSSKKL
jgi:hypothetical protein